VAWPPDTGATCRAQGRALSTHAPNTGGPTPRSDSVTDVPLGQTGPDVVNGDGNRTGFSVVETGTDQLYADAGNGDSTLAGYVSPS
jgi:hypothetical protein